MIAFTKDTLRGALQGLRVLKLGKNPLPVLQSVRVTGSDNTVHFEGTNLDQVLVYRAPAKTEGVDQLLVPYELLATVAKQAEAVSDITLTGGKEPAITYKMAGLPVSVPFDVLEMADYPPAPAPEGEAIPLAGEVLASMKEALGCASTDTSRYLLNSVLLDAQAVVATDGRQLYRRNSLDLPIREGGAIFPSSDVIHVLPDEAAQLWIWTTRGGNSFARIEVGPWRWTTKLVDGNYPNYRQVIPRIEDYPALVHLGEADVTRIKTVLPKLPGFKDANSPILLKIGRDGACLQTAPGRPKVHVALEHSEVVCPNPVSIGFNAKLLLGALQTQSRELRVRDPRSPVMLTGYSRVQLWMPVQIEEPQPMPSPVPEQKPEATVESESAPVADSPSASPSDPSSESPTPVVPVSAVPPVSESVSETQTHNPPETMVAPATNPSVSQSREDSVPGVVASRIPSVSAQPVTVVDAINQRLARLRDLLREAGTEFANIHTLVKEQQRSYRVLERDHEALKKNIRALREVNV